MKASERKCPECGAGPFQTAAAMGSHRKLKHGVAGTSTHALRKKEHDAGKPKRTYNKREQLKLTGRTSLLEAVLVLEIENKAEARVIQRLKEMVQ